jgi:YbgC/YbaW family acyl-CoA thioester hydrolase
MNLSMPEPVHATSYRVLYGDTDAAGLVYYANYLRYFEKGRTEYMRDLGWYCPLLNAIPGIRHLLVTTTCSPSRHLWRN